jgi:hypothetical protein
MLICHCRPLCNRRNVRPPNFERKTSSIADKSNHSLGTYGKSVPGGVQGNANVTIKVTGSPSYAVIAFSYLLIIVYALTLAPVCWVYAAEVWSLGTRGHGMGIAATGNWLFSKMNYTIARVTLTKYRFCAWSLCSTGLQEYLMEDFHRMYLHRRD